jgi:hypothetical protein
MMAGLLFLAALLVMVIIFEVKTLNMLYNARRRKALKKRFNEVVKDWTRNDS